jgi:hypothetical protein
MFYESITPERRAAYIANAQVAMEEAQEPVLHELGHQVVRIAEQATRAPIGSQANRYLEAEHARRWAASLENGDINNIPSHPGLSPLTYHMSKAIGDEERARVAEQHVANPASLKFPKQV